MLAGQQFAAGPGASTVLPDFDFETYSEAGYCFDPQAGRFYGLTKTNASLPAVGAAVYAEHPSTDIISLAYDLKDGKGPRLWVPGCAPPQDLFSHIQGGGLLEAWNSGFEWLIWHHVCHLRWGWPALPQAQLRCAMAKGRAFGLPGKLGKAAAVVGAGEQKDKRGEQLIRLLSVPRKPTKKDPSLRCTDPALLGEMYAYNIQDIKAEAAVSILTPDLSPQELALWQLDQKINQRGVHIDRAALDACISIVDQAQQRYSAQLQELTGGAVQAASEVSKITRWLCANGCPVGNLDSDAVDAALARDNVPDVARRVLEIRKSLGAASVKKLYAISRMLPSDNRLKDLFAYCGADRTGRWAGRGPQPQNLPNSGPSVWTCPDCDRVNWTGLVDCRCGGAFTDSAFECDWGIEAVESALSDISTKNLDWVESQWGDAVATVAGCLRGLFSAGPGKDLICSDFSAIEAVVLAFLAGEEWRMEVFRTHGKIYEAGASKITGIPLEEILQYKKDTGNHHPVRKKIGKPSELGFGYGGGVNSGKVFGADKYMTDDEIQDAVTAWRQASPAIAGKGNWGVANGLPPTPPRYGRTDEPLGLWYGLQGAAYAAIRNPGQCFTFRGIGYQMRGTVLYCRLLSGRFLVYHDAKLEVGKTPWGSETTRMTYSGNNSDYKKGPMGWTKLDTYGPKLTENCIAAGTLVLTDRGYVPIESVKLSDKVHDGVEFVNHSGSVFTANKPCVNVDGVFMTPDHEVLTDEGWKAALEKPRPYRPKIWILDRCARIAFYWKKTLLVVPMRLRWCGDKERRGRDRGGKARRAPKLWVFDKATAVKAKITWALQTPIVRNMALYAGSLPLALPSSLGKLRGPRYQGVRKMERISEFLGRYVARVQKRRHPGQDGQQFRLQPRELPVGRLQNSRPEQKKQCVDKYLLWFGDCRRSFRAFWHRLYDHPLSDKSRLAGKQIADQTGCPKSSDVYDILNCGNRHRFVVLGDKGPFIVHNCVQAIARDILANSMPALEAAGYNIVMHVHDEIIAEVPEGQGSIEEFEQIMATMPSWAADWPIKAAGGWRGKRYRKD